MSSLADFDPQFLRELRQIDLRARRSVTSEVTGAYASAYRGQGFSFEEVRPYAPGDDVRRIDWNVTARTSTPHIKVHREERELTLFLLVDVSGSQHYGSQRRTKHEASTLAAATLAYTASRANDRAGALLFTDRIEKTVPASKGRGHTWRLLRELVTPRGVGRGTNIAQAIRTFQERQRRRAVVVVISDFREPAARWSRELRTLGMQHDLTVIQVSDPTEASFPSAGLVHLRDPETGVTGWIDSGSDHVRQSIRATFDARQRETGEVFRNAHADVVSIMPADDVVDVLVHHFRQRSRR